MPEAIPPQVWGFTLPCWTLSVCQPCFLGPSSPPQSNGTPPSSFFREQSQLSWSPGLWSYFFFSTPPSSQGPKLHCLMAIVRQPSTFMSPTSPSLFVRTRSSQAPLLVVWALSSMLYRNCMDCLCAAVLSLQQMLGFLKLPMRTGASEHGSASSCVSSWPGGLQQMSTPCCPYWSDLQSLPLVICPQVELHTF